MESSLHELSPCKAFSQTQDHSQNEFFNISDSRLNPGNQLEALIANKKLAEAAEFIMDDRNYQEVKTHSFNTLVDKLCEFSHVNAFSNLLIWLIRKQSTLLTKYTMKRYFALLLKQSKMDIGHIILEEFLEAGEGVSKALLLRVYQYYISGYVECLEVGQALKAFASMKNECPYGEESMNVYLKVYETLIKGCFQGFLEEAKALVEEVAARQPNDVYFNKLIDFAAKHNDLSFAE